MGKQFNFNRLIQKYSVPCELLTELGSGKYVGGNWIPDAAPEPKEIRGAIIPMTDRKVYQSGGTYTEQDREFITLENILLESKSYIIHQGSRYHVESENDYSECAGFHDYNLKRVGAIDRSKEH